MMKNRAHVLNQVIYQRGRGRGTSGYNGNFTRLNFNNGPSRHNSTYMNVVNTVFSLPTEQANRVIIDKDRNAVTRLTDEQWRNVVQILNASRSGDSSNHNPTT